MMMPEKHAKHLPTHFLHVWMTGRVPVWDENPAWLLLAWFSIDRFANHHAFLA
jgi:hypothetical protein